VVSSSLGAFDYRPSRILDDIRHDAATLMIDRAWRPQPCATSLHSDKHPDSMKVLNRTASAAAPRAFPGEELAGGANSSEKNVSGQ
jgi:hypothetical protein